MSGHVIWATGPYLWCKRCGHHSKQKVYNLASQCMPPDKSKRGLWNRYARLSNGQSPYARAADERIGVPHRVTLEQWLALRGISLDGAPEPQQVDAAIQLDAIERDEGAELD